MSTAGLVLSLLGCLFFLASSWILFGVSRSLKKMEEDLRSIKGDFKGIQGEAQRLLSPPKRERSHDEVFNEVFNEYMETEKGRNVLLLSMIGPLTEALKLENGSSDTAVFRRALGVTDRLEKQYPGSIQKFDDLQGQDLSNLLKKSREALEATED